METCARKRPLADMTFILSSTIRILSMQSGFGLLESSFSRRMNGANIMVKNVADFVLSTPMYLVVGYALSFGYAEAPSFVGSLTRGSNDPLAA